MKPEAGMDERTTVASLKEEVTRFRDARNWKSFHEPQNLAMGLSIETGELQELFLWKSKDEVDEYVKSEKGAARLREEIADCLIFILHLAERCDLDLTSALYDKLMQNEKKYPVEKSYGSGKKYTEL